MSVLDWSIVIGLIVILTITSIRTNRYARSVSGFLAANRCAGRYLITIAYGMAQLGVISLVWFWQQNYDVGFTSIWWGFMEGPALILIALTGWVVYRFRQTRAMTMAQFFEIRYSRNFRVFAGLVAFLSGIINYGIFPAVASRFFIHLCGLPEVISLLGLEVSTFPLLMAMLLGTALLFVFLGGQIAVMVTDFIQGSFGNIVFIIVIIFLLSTFGWDQISDAMLKAPEGKSMVDPFDLGKEKNFNAWYWVISVIVLFYGMLGWQGTSGYNASAINAHEAKMANILNGWRFRVLMLITLILPICIRVMMNDESFTEQASAIQSVVDAQETAALGSEVRTPVATRMLLPGGLLGLMCAAMLGAFISTNDTYLHAWGTIFIQDVVLPFRKKPLSPRAHIWLLRFSILGVAIFAFFFSLLYTPTQYIAMFLAITGAIFVGGAGSAIIGGLYWKRGTTAAAWTAMIAGMSLSCFGIIVKQLPAATYWSGSVIEIHDQTGDRVVYEPIKTAATMESAGDWPIIGDSGLRWGITGVKEQDGAWESMHAPPSDAVTLTIVSKKGLPLRMVDIPDGGEGTSIAQGDAAFKAQLHKQSRSLISPFLDVCYYVNHHVTGQVMTFWSILTAILLYILVSLLGPRQDFNMDRLLHRGRYGDEGDVVEVDSKPGWLERLGIDKEFSTADKWVTAVTLAWPIFWTIVFLVLTTWRLTGHEIAEETWASWWQWWTWCTLVAAIIVVTWFTIGGFLDVRALYRRLRAYDSDVRDDGRVVDHQNADEVKEGPGAIDN
ncbi:MAG: hypothetical protein P8M22_10045 [Phycisphaerales bacterium]|nr:hypothetical protein [Phycisphaerales bacterium]